MTNSIMKYAISITAIFLFLMNFTFGQNSVKPVIKSKTESVQINLQESKIAIKGTSTLHDWESIAENSKATIVINNYQDADIEQLSLAVDVTSIKNTKGHNTMDKLTRKALKSDDFPKITYVFIKGDIVSNTSKELKVKLIGNLTIAGKTNKVSVLTTIDKSTDSVTLKGVHKLKMTDYGVDPPRALFGTVKTGDEITIAFSIKF